MPSCFSYSLTRTTREHCLIIVNMALPGEKDSKYPDAYFTKVPSRVHRRETRWAEKTTQHGSSYTLPRELLDVRPSFIIHGDDVLYFDYGAVRFGRKPQPECPDDTRIVCVGLGWLPDWEFTINPRGLADIKPSDAPSLSSQSSSSDDDKDGQSEAGVLGLLYKLVLDDDPPRRTGRFLFSRKPTIRVKDLSSATPKAWDKAVPFHTNLKVLRQVKVYIHVFDGGLGHKYQKEGGIVPFRTPGWSVNAVVHIDPPRLPMIRGELRVSNEKLQGEWVAKELNRWIKEAKLPPLYVDRRLREWVPCDPKTETIVYKKKADWVGLRKFIGFSPR